MQKVLVITYYWPPSGGAGVQRWLKLCKYLPEFGVQPIVLTVDPKKASYPALDESLKSEVAHLEVHRTSSFEPLRIYGKLVGKKNVPTAGFSNVNKAKWSTKLAARVRSTQFIPDPRKGWNKYALPKAKALIEANGIDKVITTGPPHSSHLIGLALQQELGVEWTTDMRDPWTDIYYYRDLHHTAASAAKDKALELSVLKEADRVICANAHLKNLLLSKDKKLDSGKFHVLTNGYDPADIPENIATGNDRFWITYTGTMSAHYAPEVLLGALAEVVKTTPNIGLRIIGTVSEEILEQAQKLGLGDHIQHIATVPHKESVAWLMRASALLLVIPEVEHANSIVPGKLFEYLGVQKTILCIGPKQGASANIIAESRAGKTFERNEKASLIAFLQELLRKEWKGPAPEAVAKFSRKTQAESLLGLLGIKPN